MLTDKITVNTKEGFHLRPAGVLVNTAKQYSCSTTIIFNAEKIDAKNVMAIVAACIKSGDEIVVECDGDDEAECMQAIIELAQNHFGEQG